MMTCETTRPLLPLHPDPGERPEIRDAIDDHLRGCPACADAWRRLQASWDALGTWEDVAPAPGFADAVHARIRASARRRRHWAPMAAAAAVLLAVTSLFLVPTVTAPGLSSADLEIVRHLDLLENYELVSAMDALEAGASADDVAPVLDLMPPAEPAGGDARKAKEY